MSKTVFVNAGPSHLVQTIRVGHHCFLSDESPDWGNDEGPDPYELLLSALGACTSMTLRLYADRKRWPLQGVEVRLRHSRIHPTDCATCDTVDLTLDQIDREISLLGELSENQRQRLLEIAERCPVHRTLLGKVRIRTTLIVGDDCDKEATTG